MSELSPITNEEKRQVYATLQSKLKTAIHQEFYLEAVLLEGAIIEDRITSLLKHRNSNYLIKNPNPQISRQLTKVKNILPGEMDLQKRVPLTLVEEIIAWRDVRNALVHRSCQRIYQSDEVKSCALEGKELVRKLCNAVSKANLYHQKTQNNQ